MWPLWEECRAKARRRGELAPRSLSLCARSVKAATTTAADRFANKRHEAVFMSDYLLLGMPNRLARKGKEFVTFRFWTGCLGPIAASESCERKAALFGRQVCR
jgi:hypothetical protein